MTQDVDPDTFYSVGIRLFELAGDVYDAFAVNVRILGETGTMAGTDDAGTAWAASYDGRASEVLGAVNDLTLAMENYGGVVIQAGYNHAVAEYNATPGNQGPPPERPREPPSIADHLNAPPSAGGPGKGLFDNALGLVEQVGVPVPDGDTHKVETPKASELEDYATSQGWTKTETPTGPAKYVDENGVARMTIKHGSPRTPGSEAPHVELREANGQRIDPFGNPVTQRSDGNHTPVEWDW